MREIRVGVLYFGDGSPDPYKINDVVDFVSYQGNRPVEFDWTRLFDTGVSHYVVSNSDLNKLGMEDLTKLLKVILHAQGVIREYLSVVESVEGETVLISDGTLGSIDLNAYIRDDQEVIRFSLDGSDGTMISAIWRI